jgi:hypothetical protein
VGICAISSSSCASPPADCASRTASCNRSGIWISSHTLSACGRSIPASSASRTCGRVVRGVTFPFAGRASLWDETHGAVSGF